MGEKDSPGAGSNVAKSDENDGAKASQKTAWFGAAVARATDYGGEIPWRQGPAGGGRGGGEQFPQWLKDVMEPHISKCRKNREEAMQTAKEEARRRPWWGEWDTAEGSLSERDHHWDTGRHDLKKHLCEATGCEVELEVLHESDGLKELMLSRLADRARNIAFQRAYDKFVLDAVAPLIQEMVPECGQKLYYQSFPCTRVVRPGDFSIGPHADCQYGHSPTSINLYVPLTRLYGSNALYIESSPGREDWHPIEGSYGYLKAFAGGACAHWTTENHTESTRVSVDFRVIPGSRWLDDGWSKKDTFTVLGGYYSCAVLREGGVWERQEVGKVEGEGDEAALLPPDARVGFPFTNPPPRTRKGEARP